MRSFELQLRKKIKVVKSDGEKYYGRYDIMCNVWSPPCVFFNNCEIFLQHVMLSKPTMNKVVEWWNYTCADMVRSLIFIYQSRFGER